MPQGTVVTMGVQTGAFVPSQWAMPGTANSTMWEEILEKGVHSLVAKLSDSEAIAMGDQWGTHNYKPLPINVVRGEGALVWDAAGNEYIDCIGAYSAMAHGHLAKEIVQAAKDQLDHVAVVSRAFNNAEVSLFLKGLAQFADMDMVCPMNTGAEAIETCIKLARKWGYTKKGVPNDQAEIIVFEDNFHGRTTTIVGFSTEPGYKEGFGPFTPGFKVVPFGDINAVRNAITPNTVAILGEPIQAEGGIIMPPDGWMTELRQLCDANNVLLIWDEIQVGFYRTGDKFAWMHEAGAKPDLMAVGKPLGGGLVPVSAAIGTKEVMSVFGPGDHGSTFGGNPFGAAIALTAMAVFETGGFKNSVPELGRFAMERLNNIDSPKLKEIRGRGLLIGVEVNDDVDSKKMSEELTKRGVLTKETRNRTFRLTPPLTISQDLLADALDRVEAAILAV